jgi:hypothetical protein
VPDQTPIDGPIPVTAIAIPGGAALSLTTFARLVIEDVLDALLDEQDTTLWDRLHELADTTAAPTPEGRLPYEELVTDLAERAPSQVPLYGGASLELARRLRMAVAPKAVPAQREAGAA